MRDLYYENQGNSTYLVYDVKEQDAIDSMSLGMLTNNNIHGLAQTLFTQMNSQKFIKYNVSAKVSVAQFFAGAVNKKRLLGVFSGIVNAMMAAEDYMLDPASIIMDLDYIFTDVSSCETDLICVPLVDTEMKQPDLGMFFRNIMFNTRFDQTENCDHVAKIINYLNGTPLFSLSDFKKLLEEIQRENAQPASAGVKRETRIQPAAAQIQPVQPPKKPTPPVAAPAERMNVPPEQKKAIPETPPAVDAKGEKSEISFFYLMQHYNKENAAAYKAQKEARKRAAASKGKKAEKKISDKGAPSAAQPANNFGFAVPGQTPPAVQVSSQPTVQKSTAPAPQPAYAPEKGVGNVAAGFGETTLLNESSMGETTLLTETNDPAKMTVPHLIRRKNNEKIFLNKPIFRVGKERSYADYHISDNQVISRSHANFITRDGEYFVVDTNSTNHTFLNGRLLQSNVETAISHGDIIRLANEEFDFMLY